MPKDSSLASGTIKSPDEIAIMAEGGRKLSRILKEVLGKVRFGISTDEIDSWIEDRIVDAGGEPSFKMVPGYHWASCVGLNEEVVHSIPSREKIIKEGDLLKVDLGVLYKGFHTDMARTIQVQSSIPRLRSGQEFKVQSLNFLEAGERALEEAIEMARAGNRVGHISQKIEAVIKKSGFRPVEVLTGHGIGRKLHEDPLISGILKRKLKDTLLLVKGMTLAIEVIYCLGEPEVVLKNDGWTIVTKDGKIAGLFEKTIAITEDHPLILTP